MKTYTHHQEYIIKHFIEATKYIAMNEGLHKITIRNVAEQADYNSATIYNYFENLDQLVALAMIDSIADYLALLEKIQKLDEISLVKFLLAWRCYAEYSFANPEIYSYIFSSSSSDYVLSQIDLYFTIFPLKDTDYENLNTIVTSHSLNNRDSLLINPCVEDGFFKASDRDYIMRFCYIVHSGIMQNLIVRSQSNPKKAVKEFLAYIIDFLNIYLINDQNFDFSLNKILDIDCTNY